MAVQCATMREKSRELGIICIHTGCAILRRYPEEALRYVEQGRENGWEPNGDIYELLINWLCTTATSAPKAIAQSRQDIAGVAVITDVENVRAFREIHCCSPAIHICFTSYHLFARA